MRDADKLKKYDAWKAKQKQYMRNALVGKQRLSLLLPNRSKAILLAYAAKRQQTLAQSLVIMLEQVGKQLAEDEIAAHMPKEKVTVPVYDTELRVDTDGWAIWDEETPDEKAAAIQPKAKPMPIVPDYNEDDMQRELDEAHKRWPIDPPPAPLNNLDFLED